MDRQSADYAEFEAATCVNFGLNGVVSVETMCCFSYFEPPVLERSGADGAPVGWLTSGQLKRSNLTGFAALRTLPLIHVVTTTALNRLDSPPGAAPSIQRFLKWPDCGFDTKERLTEGRKWYRLVNHKREIELGVADYAPTGADGPAAKT